MKSLLYKFRIALFIPVMLLFSGCAKKPPNRVELLLDWWPNPVHVPIFAGLQNGIFEKYGIDLHITKVSDAPETIPFLLSKRADLALYYMPNTIMACEKINQLRAVATYIDQPLNAFMFREDSDISGIFDMHGKVLGGFPDGLIQAYISNLSPTSGIEFSQFRRLQSDLVAALYTRTVDMITGIFWNIEGEQLASLGVETKHFLLSELGFPNYHELVFLSRDDFLEANPSLKERFQKAIHESIEYSTHNPMDAYNEYLRMNPDKDLATQGWERLAWQKTIPLFAADQSIQPHVWNEFREWMYIQGLLASPVDLTPLLSE